MCIVIYMAASSPPPLIQWNKEAPAFHVTTEIPSELPRRRFSLPHIVYVGSSEGCGCGFHVSYGGLTPPTDAELEPSTREDRRQLFAYLQEQVAKGPVELWIVWSGDEALDPAEVMDITIDQWSTKFDELDELMFVKIRPARTQLSL